MTRGGIAVEASGPATARTLTNYLGQFVFKGVPCGSYLVTPSQPGMLMAPRSATVTGSIRDLKFTAVEESTGGTTLATTSQLRVSTLATGFVSPAGLWGDAANLYVSDSGDGTIRRIDIATGAISLLTGQPGLRGSADGTPAEATFDSPGAIWGDGSYLYVADGFRIRRVTVATGEVATLLPAFSGVSAIWGDGLNLYVSEIVLASQRSSSQPDRSPLLPAATVEVWTTESEPPQGSTTLKLCGVMAHTSMSPRTPTVFVASTLAH